MTHSERRWLTATLVGLVGMLVLACLAAVVGLVYLFGIASTLVRPDGPIPAEHQQLMQDLRAGKYTKLEDIRPKPGGVCGPEKMLRPHLQARYFLSYSIPNSRNLMLVVDKDLRLIDHYFYDD